MNDYETGWIKEYRLLLNLIRSLKIQDNEEEKLKIKILTHNVLYRIKQRGITVDE